MLSMGILSRQPQCCACAINSTPISRFLPLFSKIPQPHVFFPSNEVAHLIIPSILWRERTGAKGKEKGVTDVVEIESLDDGDDMDGFLVGEDGEDEDDDEDDDEVIIPLRNMKKWLDNKPRGFGIGKEYDTSVEDKMMEEIEQSKKAQLANINKLRNNPVIANSKKELDKDVQEGFRVRLVNLPKKMNIDKDLRAAFKGVPGITNIVPVVTGNKKTRDPVCKGLAFIDFKSKDAAQRFVQMFSGRSISFGKVEKQIKCEMINPGSPKSTTMQSFDEIKYAPQQAAPDHLDDDDLVTEILSSDSDEDVSTDRLSKNSEVSSAESSSGDEQDIREETFSSEKEKKVEAKEKKKPKLKKEKVSKLNIPGSARKLKIKEKNLLTGVLSKYAQKNTISAVKEQS